MLHNPTHLDFNDPALEVVQDDDDVVRVCGRVGAVVAAAVEGEEASEDAGETAEAWS